MADELGEGTRGRVVDERSSTASFFCLGLRSFPSVKNIESFRSTFFLSKSLRSFLVSSRACSPPFPPHFDVHQLLRVSSLSPPP
ncbi:unnamed protein product [Calypogeia fissa]